MVKFLKKLAEAAETGVPNDGAACVCNGRTEPVVTTLIMAIEEGGETFTVEVPAIKCIECETVRLDENANKLCHAAACRHMGLLTPGEVAEVRRNLGMSCKTFGEVLKVSCDSVRKWENGKLHQNNDIDNKIRNLSKNNNMRSQKAPLDVP